MKLILAALTMMTLQLHAHDKETTLANKNDFVVLSDIDAPEIGVFLSYTGRQFDHCGIALHTHSFVVDTATLHGLVQIDKGPGETGTDTSVIEEYGIVSKVDPDRTTFGQFFTIKTRGGETLREAIAKSAPHSSRKPEVIVKILGCN